MEKLSLVLQIASLCMTGAIYLQFKRLLKDAQVREAITRKFIQGIRTKLQEAKKEKAK